MSVKNFYCLAVESFKELALRANNQWDYKPMLDLEFPTPKAISGCESGFNSGPPSPVNPFFILVDRNKPLKARSIYFGA